MKKLTVGGKKHKHTYKNRKCTKCGCKSRKIQNYKTNKCIHTNKYNGGDVPGNTKEMAEWYGVEIHDSKTTPVAQPAPIPKTQYNGELSTVTDLDDFILDYDRYYKGKRNIGILVFDKIKYNKPTITKSIVLDELNLLSGDDVRNDLIDYFDKSTGNIKTLEYGGPMYNININWVINDDYRKKIAESIKRQGLIPIEEQIETQTREAKNLIQIVESLKQQVEELRTEHSNLQASIEQLKHEKNLQTKKSMFSNLNPFTNKNNKP
jgi:hypothetical protein